MYNPRAPPKNYVLEKIKVSKGIGLISIREETETQYQLKESVEEERHRINCRNGTKKQLRSGREANTNLTVLLHLKSLGSSSDGRVVE